MSISPTIFSYKTEEVEARVINIEMAELTMPFFLLLLLLLLLLSSSPSPTTAGKCNKDDKRALLAIKSSFNNGNSFPGWNSSIVPACCDWSGIDCDPGVADGRVTGIEFFADPSLSGSIPSAVGDLPFLTLILFHKLPLLINSIPPSITRLTRLSTLLLSWNSLSGPIPSFLSQIPTLFDLDLSFNKFQGSIPPELSLLQNLAALRLDRNQLTGSIPASFARFNKTSPPDLYLSHNNLSGEIPPELGGLVWGTVDLSRNRLSGDPSFLFGETKSTIEIDLSRNLFVFDLTRVTFPVNLTWLDLNHNQITGSIPAQLNRVNANMQLLNVSYNRLCGEIPAGAITAKFGADAFFHNKCLCGSPLPAC